MYVSLLVLSVLVYAAALFVYLRHPSASVFHPATFYLLFHGLVFVVRPIFAWYYDFDNLYQSINFKPAPWDKARVLICTNLGLVAFLAVGLRFAREPIEFRQDVSDVAARPRRAQRPLVDADAPSCASELGNDRNAPIFRSRQRSVFQE